MRHKSENSLFFWMRRKSMARNRSMEKDPIISKGKGTEMDTVWGDSMDRVSL